MTIGGGGAGAKGRTTSGSSSRLAADHPVGTHSEPARTLKKSSSKQQRFEIIRKLGSGTYGKVSLALDHRIGEQVAIKIIKKQAIENAQDLLRIKREIRIMSALRHPNIIEIKEVFENSEKIVIIMEYASGGELYDYVSNFGPLAETEVRRIFRQIVSAVYYCHKNHVTHRDLKLENILLDEKMNAKIADFGLSNYFSDKEMLHTFCGSPLYASPEIINGIPYRGPEVDCWSLGVLLYSLAYSSMPFDGRDFNRMIRQIKRGIYYEPDSPSSEPTELIEIYVKMSTERRATIDDIAKHWWLNFDTDEPTIQDLPENQVVEKERLDLEEQSAPGLQVQTFIDESEIFAEFIHLNAATRKRIEEFRKKRKEADAFLTSTRDRLAKGSTESATDDDPIARLQALEQQLHSLSRKTSAKDTPKEVRKESINTDVSMDGKSWNTLKVEARLSDQSWQSASKALKSGSDIGQAEGEEVEDDDTRNAIEQSILAEGNRLANQLVEEQYRGAISVELVEKIKKMHEQYEIPVLKELLDSVLRFKEGQEAATCEPADSPQDLPDIVRLHERRQSVRTYVSNAGPDIIQQNAKPMETSQAESKDGGEADEEEQEVLTVEYEDLEDVESEQDSSKSTLDDSVANSLTSESDDVRDEENNKPGSVKTCRSNDTDSSEFSVGLSKRQSRGKYERNKFKFGREIAIEESPRLSRKRLGGAQPEVKDAPALFDRAKKYILQYPDALASTDSMQQKVVASLEEPAESQTANLVPVETIYKDTNGQPKLYKVLWPRASLDLPCEEDGQPEKNDASSGLEAGEPQPRVKDTEERERAISEVSYETSGQPSTLSDSKISRKDKTPLPNIRYGHTSLDLPSQQPSVSVDSSLRGRAQSASDKTSNGYYNYEYRPRATYVPSVASVTNRYNSDVSSTDKGSSYRSYASSVYPYYGRSTYRTQLENREVAHDARSAYNKQRARRFLYNRLSWVSYLDEPTGPDGLPEYAPRAELRSSYGRNRYSADYQSRQTAVDKPHSYDTSGHHYTPSGNRSHSLFELSAPTKRFSIASYSTSISSTGDSIEYSRPSAFISNQQQQQPRRRARSLYDTREIGASAEYQDTTKYSRDTPTSIYPAVTVGMKSAYPSSSNYGKTSNDNFSYRRSLYDVDDGLGSSGSSAGQRHGRTPTKSSVKLRAHSFDKHYWEAGTGEGTVYMSLLNKPYVYPVHCHTAYQDTSGNELADYPRNPPDASIQPVKGILKKKAVSSNSSTPTDDDSGYSSVPAMDMSSAGGDKGTKNGGYFNWRAKSPAKSLGIMDRLRRRMNNNDRDADDAAAAEAKGYRSSSALENRSGSSCVGSSSNKYNKLSSAVPSSAYYGSGSTITDKDASCVESLEKNQKPRKKKNLWNLGRRRTVEMTYQSPKTSMTGEDSAYFKRPSSPLEKLKGFFVSTPTATTSTAAPASVGSSNGKSRSFGYAAPSAGIGSTVSKLSNKSAYMPVADTGGSSAYSGSGASKANAITYRKFTKPGTIRPHSTYASPTSRNWYEDSTYY